MSTNNSDITLHYLLFILWIILDFDQETQETVNPVIEVPDNNQVMGM